MSLSSLCAQVLLSLWSEAAEAMPAVWTWMAGKGGEEPRCLCLLSVFKGCSLCGVRQQRPCQLWLLDGLQGGEELWCLCLLSVWKWCAHRVMSDHGHASNCWMARERPCQEGVFVLRILKEGLKVPSPQGPT